MCTLCALQTRLQGRLFSLRGSFFQRHFDKKRRLGSWQRTGAQLKEAPGQEDRPPDKAFDTVQERSDLTAAASSSSPSKNYEAGGAAEQVGNLGRILIWVLTLMLGIGFFYGSVSMASNVLSLWLKDRVSFTKKEFVPYSERRRLEQMSSEPAPPTTGPAPPSNFGDVLKLIPAANG